MSSRIVEKINFVLNDRKNVSKKALIFENLFLCKQPLSLLESQYYFKNIFKNEAFDKFLLTLNNKSDVRFEIATWIDKTFFSSYINEEGDEISNDSLDWGERSENFLRKIIKNYLKTTI